jgi:hypothetical protein
MAVVMPMALAIVASALCFVACKPTQNTETMLFNTGYGVKSECSEEGRWFALRQPGCVAEKGGENDFGYLSVYVRPVTKSVPVIWQTVSEVPFLRERVDFAFDFASDAQRLPDAEVRRSVALLAYNYGSELVATPNVPRWVVPVGGGAGSVVEAPIVRPLVPQVYRLADFLRPGLQALGQAAWMGSSVTGTHQGVWAALSATHDRVEMPSDSFLSGAKFLSYLAPRAGSTNAGKYAVSMAGKPYAMEVVKEFARDEFVPLSVTQELQGANQPRDAEGRFRLRLTEPDQEIIARRNRGLRPGDILLVVARPTTAPIKASSRLEEPAATGAVTSGAGAGTAPGGAGGSQPSGGKVSALLAGSTARDANPGRCFAATTPPRLVHAAVLVERDVWFETVIPAPGFAFFRFGLFDHLVGHTQWRSHIGANPPRSLSLEDLCFVVVRMSLKPNVPHVAPDGTMTMDPGYGLLPLASALGDKTAKTAPLVSAAEPPAASTEANLSGRFTNAGQKEFITLR